VGVAEADAIGRASMAATKALGAAQPLGAPFTLWRFFVLVAATCGIYLLFWSYRIARDAEAVTGEPRKAWLYPFSLLIPPLAAIVVTVVISDCDEARATRDPARKRSRAGLCGSAFFVGLALLNLASATEIPVSGMLAAFLACALLALPAEAAINRARLELPLQRRDTVGGFAPWHYVLLVPGVALWILIAVYVRDSEWQRLTGHALAAGQPHHVMNYQYTVTPPDSGWARVARLEDPDLEDHLVGPHEQQAVFYVYEDDSIDSLMQTRRDRIADHESHAPECREIRTFDDEHGNVEALLACRTRPTLGSRTLYTIKAIDDGERIAEILVSATVATEQTDAVADAGRTLAESFRPAS
jgi:hypothetical protein